MIWRIFITGLRLICYGWLCFAVFLGVAFILVVNGEYCQFGSSFGAIACQNATAQWIAEMGQSMFLRSLFTGYPVCFILGGFAFAVYDGVALLRRR